MGLRYKRSIRICKGVKVNFGKTGASITIGTRGMHHTVHTSGKKTTSVGIPGTGLYYVSSSGGKKRKSSGVGKKATNSIQSRNTIQQKKIEYSQNCEMVDDFNNLLYQIKNIHVECSDPIDWIALSDTPAPFSETCIGPNEKLARQTFDDAKPSLLGRFIPAIDKNRMETLEAAIQEGREKDHQLYSDWESLRKIAFQVLHGDIDTYFYVVSSLAPFDAILDFGSDFDIGTDSPNYMEVEFHAKTSKVVPNHVLSLSKTGKLSSKVMTKTMHYDIALDYICSCVLRIAREMFALLPINTVIIHAVDTVQDATGNEYDDTVLSVRIPRNQLEDINFDLIDVSDTIQMFECNMSFKKTQGLKAVSRIEYNQAGEVL